MGEPIRREEVVEFARLRIPQKTRKPQSISFLDAFSLEIQELEDANWELLVGRYLDNAIGVQLDVWGDVINEQRDGLTDAEFRQIIFARLLSDRYDTDTLISPHEVLIKVAGFATGASRVRIVEVFPKALRITYIVSIPLSTTQRDRAVRLIRRCKSGGTRISWIAEALPVYFGFEGDASAEGFDVGQFASIVG